MRALRWVVLAIVLAGAGAAGYHHVRNPEHLTLDAAARRAAQAQSPGAFVTLTDGVTHYEMAGPADGRVAVLVH
ncbi:conserved hypothetical protein, partial [Ricinus communis]